MFLNGSYFLIPYFLFLISYFLLNMWSLSNIADKIHGWLYHQFNPTLALIMEMVIAGIAVISLFAVLGLILVLMERKVSAWMQIRLGPNRVGPKGIFQSLADTLKLLVKEGMRGRRRKCRCTFALLRFERLAALSWVDTCHGVPSGSSWEDWPRINMRV